MSKSKVIKAGIGYTIGNYLLKGLSFLTIPVFARLLSTEDYGIVNSFSAYESIVFVIIGLAIHTSFKNARYKYQLISEGAEPGKDYRTYVSNAFLLIWINGAFWMIMAFIFRNQLSQLLKLEFPLIVLLIVYSTCNAVVIAYNSDISINYEYKKYLVVAGIHSIGNILMSLVFILFVWPETGYLGRIIGIVIPVVFIGVYLTLMQIKKNRPFYFSHMMKWGIKYSLPIIPHGISQVILSSFDRVMIANMISYSTSGIYSFAYNIFTILQVTATSIDTVWNPWFYEKRRLNDFGSIKKYGSIYTTFLLLISTEVMLLSPELVFVLGGNKYTESVFCVIPIICGGFFTFLYSIPATVEYYYGKTGIIAIATVFAAGINVVTNYIFINIYGYIAAAYTTLATYFLYFIFHYIMAKIIDKKLVFPDRTIWLSVISVICVATIAYLTIQFLWVRLCLAIFIMLFFMINIERKTKWFSMIIYKYKAR